TRLKCDWSSDVCSSDLVYNVGATVVQEVETSVSNQKVASSIPCRSVLEQDRSEERRVGKECRSWWSPYHSEKNKHSDQLLYSPLFSHRLSPPLSLHSPHT